MSDKTKVTTHHPFYIYEDVPVFSVNADVPESNALEVAANLMLYAETLSAADAFMDKTLESAIVQHLSETARALMHACGHVSNKKGKDTL